MSMLGKYLTWLAREKHLQVKHIDPYVVHFAHNCDRVVAAVGKINYSGCLVSPDEVF